MKEEEYALAYLTIKKLGAESILRVMEDMRKSKMKLVDKNRTVVRVHF